MEAWMKQLMKDVESVAGPDKLSHFQVTVLPQILADFYKTLQAQSPGRTASEQYRMDDGSMEIELKGVKQADGNVKVTDARAYRV